MPPSCLYIATKVGHMPGSFSPACLLPNAAKDADWIDNRVRTMSNGYVKQTEVMPAIPPHNSLWKGLKEAPGLLSKICYDRLTVSPHNLRLYTSQRTYLFVEIVATKLDS